MKSKIKKAENCLISPGVCGCNLPQIHCNESTQQFGQRWWHKWGWGGDGDSNGDNDNNDTDYCFSFKLNKKHIACFSFFWEFLLYFYLFFSQCHQIICTKQKMKFKWMYLQDVNAESTNVYELKISLSHIRNSNCWVVFIYFDFFYHTQFVSGKRQHVIHVLISSWSNFLRVLPSLSCTRKHRHPNLSGCSNR